MHLYIILNFLRFVKCFFKKTVFYKKIGFTLKSSGENDKYEKNAKKLFGVSFRIFFLIKLNEKLL